ncbi:uncharacterized protein HMPREF1541_08998 [Cyphellophora europaea CBS 101466]|uniref:Cytochrome P450 n=1 Tax=Cyphellophora europaea (strain CBS 101466) TaxID=1220924 RepID=W2RK51_CYPE1|nr:uncharacterized protein HMPREF1541_08998 [Cyphellophora europaea CBS 101466]ETN36720.1 hypothetical protein HMPREF1541_08998 [Cyphellophora europaea CBS 101466]
MVGSDTTATAMHMALFFAMTNPRVWGCLHCEIQKEEQSGLSTPVSASQCQQMPYLDAPERWLPGANPGRVLDEMNNTLDLVFGYGKNACLGKSIALIEMQKFVAELSRRFDMSIVRPERPFKSSNRNGLFIQEDMLVRFEKRSCDL